MSTKNNLLDILEKNRSATISGQALAGKLNISRAAVWKAIKSLQADGHKIIASSNKGYMLLLESDIISAEGISTYLDKPIQTEIDIIVKNRVESTNNIAKQIIVSSDKIERPIVIIANEQTSGRGRHGRRFISPADTGIYMSIALKSDQISDIMLGITSATAVAVCKTIEHFTSNRAEIKWVNDIFVNGKKVSGILTEGITNFESGEVESVVIGVGLNVTTDFGGDLSEVAGSIMPSKQVDITRNQIVAKLIEQIFTSLRMMKHNKKNIMSEYRNRSLLLGSEIEYKSGNLFSTGLAVDINEIGNLIVEDKNGNTIALKSGEVTLKFNKPKEK